MRYTRVKVIKGKNRLYYYIGDGLHFHIISEKKALAGLKSGAYSLWERNISKGWAHKR